ncbi:sensor histidine kinase [Conexibacter woesei]|uniref:sensor histidine kinase n=1 Tax=Conexibacter woesei TaxID=191495 RepID=UPI0003FA83FB|nr:ATP-binding protein [Conexibacter woesei]
MSGSDGLDLGAELDALASALSHDLRAPLRAIDGFSRILLSEERVGVLPDETRRFLELVRDAGTELAELLDDVVDVARVTRVPLAARELDVGVLARELIAAVLGPSVPVGRDVEWVIADGMPGAVGDQVLVRRLLLELLDNAVKFGATRVEVGWDADAGAWFVADDGAGWRDGGALPAQALEIFGRLVGRDEHPGTGAGLALAVRICGRHGGRLWGRAAPDGGATFWFTLAPA